MKRILSLLMLTLLVGCQTVPPATKDQLHSEYYDATNLDKAKTFEAIDIWLARNIPNLQKVIQLKDKEAGVFILKPDYEYSVIGIKYVGSYTFEIRVADNNVKYSFDVGPVVWCSEVGYFDKNDIYPRGNKLKDIKNNFAIIHEGINKSLGL